MGISTREMMNEERQLEMVIEEARTQLNKNAGTYNGFKKELIKYQKNMREEISLVGGDLDDVALIWQYQTDIDRQGMILKNVDKQVKKLLRILNSPYFGRMDFIEDGGENAEKVYIGISNLTKERTGEYLVHDWRAPICSMFYDFEEGKAFYECPAGIIRGEVLLKRQYRIKNGKLIFAIESSLKIDDEILQEMLARNASGRMKSIVTTIQKEQNRVIRNEKDKVLIVTGPAGCGKTSVALHRAAFLLYRYRDSIKSEDIIIFSPNSIFSDYISNVLPELGEDDVKRLTFNELAESVLGAAYKMESPGQLMEYLLGLEDAKPEAEEIGYKCSGMFLEKILAYVNHLETDGFRFEDVYFNNQLIVSGDELEKQYYKELRFLPVIRRLEKIKNRILYLLSEPEKQRSIEVKEALEKTGQYFFKEELRHKCMRIVNAELEPVRKLIDNMTSYNIFDAYECVAIHHRTAETRKERKGEDTRSINYEDIAILVLLKVMLEGISYDAKHIIVDELQDYSVVQMEILKRIYPYARFTMLGDVNQLINPLTGNSNMDFLQNLFDKGGMAGIINLNKTYRSTKEIADFCNAIIKEDVQSVERNGAKPVIETGMEKGIMVQKIIGNIVKAKDDGYASTAVICRTFRQAKNLYDRLASSVDIKLMAEGEEGFCTGAVILPSYLAKGLEFDVVLVVCEERDYGNSLERNLFYTVCTRALHVLNLYCEKTPPDFIPDIADSLYELKSRGNQFP